MSLYGESIYGGDDSEMSQADYAVRCEEQDKTYWDGGTIIPQKSASNILTSENYFSIENNLKYIGSSQFKAFEFCESAGLAQARGEYREEETTALLVGSYVDAYFEGTLDLFKAKHPALFCQTGKNSGSLKSDYVQAESIILRMERDKMLMKHMSGQKQVIMTGIIAGVPFKIKIDSYHPGKEIVDGKVMKDLEDVWNKEEHRYVPFWMAWGYDFQGAIYQEVERQNSGIRLPFIIAAATKQKSATRLQIGQIEQSRLDYCLDIVKHDAPRFDAIKRGEIEPERCETCDYCAETAVLSEIVDYREMD